MANKTNTTSDKQDSQCVYVVLKSAGSDRLVSALQQAFGQEHIVEVLDALSLRTWGREHSIEATFVLENSNKHLHRVALPNIIGALKQDDSHQRVVCITVDDEANDCSGRWPQEILMRAGADLVIHLSELAMGLTTLHACGQSIGKNLEDNNAVLAASWMKDAPRIVVGSGLSPEVCASQDDVVKAHEICHQKNYQPAQLPWKMGKRTKKIGQSDDNMFFEYEESSGKGGEKQDEHKPSQAMLRQALHGSSQQVCADGAFAQDDYVSDTHVERSIKSLDHRLLFTQPNKSLNFQARCPNHDQINPQSDQPYESLNQLEERIDQCTQRSEESTVQINHKVNRSNCMAKPSFSQERLRSEDFSATAKPLCLDGTKLGLNVGTHDRLASGGTRRQRGKLMVVTGLQGGSGASSIAQGLACWFAGHQISTILIDTQPMRQVCARSFGLALHDPEPPGLSPSQLLEYRRSFHNAQTELIDELAKDRTKIDEHLRHHAREISKHLLLFEPPFALMQDGQRRSLLLQEFIEDASSYAQVVIVDVGQLLLGELSALFSRIDRLITALSPHDIHSHTLGAYVRLMQSHKLARTRMFFVINGLMRHHNSEELVATVSRQAAITSVKTLPHAGKKLPAMQVNGEIIKYFTSSQRYAIMLAHMAHELGLGLGVCKSAQRIPFATLEELQVNKASMMERVSSFLRGEAA